MTSPSIVPLFATPIVTCIWEDAAELNAGLTDRVLELRKSQVSAGRSTVGGWHSALSFFDDSADCVVELKARLKQLTSKALQQFTKDSFSDLDSINLEGWANVLDKGGYNSLHCHPNAAWSGVYYVNGNNAAKSAFGGKLELIDPRPGASLHYSEDSNLYGRFLVDPSPGQVVVFPGWLQHLVHPYEGQESRVSIAFNLI